MRECSVTGNIQSHQKLYIDELEKKEELKVSIDSTGGDAFSGMTMFDQITRMKKKNRVFTVGYGVV